MIAGRHLEGAALRLVLTAELGADLTGLSGFTAAICAANSSQTAPAADTSALGSFSTAFTAEAGAVPAYWTFTHSDPSLLDPGFYAANVRYLDGAVAVKLDHVIVQIVASAA